MRLQVRKAVEPLRTQVYERDAYTCRLCRVMHGKLTIHHILPVWARPDLVASMPNLATVCRRCHRKLNGHELEYVSYFGRRVDELPPGIRQPRGQSTVLVPKAVHILSVQYVGIRPTYDIEMESPHHNFVANGIVTHNSQLSQRYVSGRVLRFVERPEYRDDPELHRLFCDRIDAAAAGYARLTELLLERQKAGEAILSAEARTDLRKKVQQCSRSLLPNETEAPLVMTANARAWRHIIEMRASAHAEVEIREMAFRVYRVLRQAAPLLFGDYEERALPDGTRAVETPYPKV